MDFFLHIYSYACWFNIDIDIDMSVKSINYSILEPCHIVQNVYKDMCNTVGEIICTVQMCRFNTHKILYLAQKNIVLLALHQTKLT